MKAIYIERFGAPDVLTYGDRADPVTAEDDSDHVAGMVSNSMVRLLLVRLAWACCKPRTQVAEGRARKARPECRSHRCSQTDWLFH